MSTAVDAATGDDLESITASLEAAHAVMRWLCRLPCTAVSLGQVPGDGFCAGTGRVIPAEAQVLVAMAGPASEAGFIPQWLDLTVSRSDDLDQARELLLSLWPAWDVEAALQHYFEWACDVLCNETELIERMADGLLYSDERRLSARSVAALCREHARRRARSAAKRSKAES